MIKETKNGGENNVRGTTQDQEGTAIALFQFNFKKLTNNSLHEGIGFYDDGTRGQRQKLVIPLAQRFES